MSKVAVRTFNVDRRVVLELHLRIARGIGKQDQRSLAVLAGGNQCAGCLLRHR
jgi:hypothetical protein